MHLSYFDKCLLWIVLSVARFVSTAVVCWAFTCVPYCHERAMMKVAALARAFFDDGKFIYPIDINIYVLYAIIQSGTLVQIV